LYSSLSLFRQGRGQVGLIVTDYKKDIIGVSSNDNKLLLALSLRKQREKSGSTVRAAAERLGSKSPNAYAQYEKGRIRISLEKYEQLLQAANPFKHALLRLV
jgi:Helix-turn-helix domain